MARHEDKREQLLHYGLHQILYVKKVFEMSTEELIETILRENERMGNFPNHTRKEILDWVETVGRDVPKRLPGS